MTQNHMKAECLLVINPETLKNIKGFTWTLHFTQTKYINFTDNTIEFYKSEDNFFNEELNVSAR